MLIVLIDILIRSLNISCLAIVSSSHTLPITNVNSGVR